MPAETIARSAAPHVTFRNVTEQLAAVSFADLPPACVERAKDICTDILGCILGGGTAPASQAVCRLAAVWGGPKESTVPGYSRKVAAHHAAFATAFMARAFDFGVNGSSALGQSKAPVHISETLVPVAFAMGEKAQLSGRELLAALVAGEDFAGRLSASMDFSVPLDCRGTINTLGAALVAGKLLRLSPEGIGHALAIALHQLGGIKQGIQFNLGQGFSGMQGILAAELAAENIPGVSDPVAEGAALLGAFSSSFDAATFFDGFGTQFHTSVSFKPYPCCRATHSAVECALALLEQGLDSTRIATLTLRVSPWTRAHLVGRPFALRENHHADAIFSLQYVLASTLLRGSCRVEHFTGPFIRDPRVMALAERILVTSEGWPLNEGDPRLSAIVQAEDEDGTRREAAVRFPRGHELVGPPLDEREKKEKFFANLELTTRYSPARIEAIYSTVRNLDALASVSTLMDMLAD